MPSLIAAALFGASLKIAPAMLTFTYEPHEAGEIYACRHTIENEAAQDWDVRCRSADGKTEKRYGVHLWVTRYPHQQEPKLSIETLYWVTDRTNPTAPVSGGTTVWHHLKDETALYGIDVREAVENDTASLRLGIDFRPKPAAMK